MNSRLLSVMRQKGVTMLEVLVTIFVLAVGLLGLAILQFTATESNMDAYVRSQASFIAQDLAERMRLNRQYINRTATTLPARVAASDNRYTDLTNYNFNSLSSCTTGGRWDCYCADFPGSLTNCRDNVSTGGALTNATADCTAEQLALFDAYEVSCMAAKISPDLMVSADCEDVDTSDGDGCSANSIHTIYLSWPASETKGGAGNTERSTRGDGSLCPTGSELGLSDTTPRDCVSINLVLGGLG